MNIALVESSRAVRSALVKLLEAGGHEISVFSDARVALDRIFRDQSLEAVITAAELEPISGMELCWEARLIAGGQRPLYIMLMTSLADERTMIECLDMGADEIISKPPSKKELFARLRVGERNVRLQGELIRLATTDPMTGLLNRRAFFERGVELCKTKQKGNRVAAILFDIDHFKEINDLYGHQTGDTAICAIADEARHNQFLVGRVGGDEICILLNGHDLSCAWNVAEELRCRISTLIIKTPGGSTTITCSFGVGELRWGADIDDLIRDADFALYRAKLEGRDCVSTPPPLDWMAENPRHTSTVVRARARR
jgi:two-component system, cell cycle response regulator